MNAYMPETLIFLRSCIVALKNANAGEKVEFECPVCGEKAFAIKSTYNGHRSGKCESCDISFRE